MARLRNILDKARSNIIPIAAYSFLSIILTYPVAFSGDLMPGEGDAFQYLWFFWWFKNAILSVANPYFTNYIYYPDGVWMVFSDVSPLNAIASIPLQIAFGLITSYKIIWLLTFILSGYGMFLLANYLIGDKKVAFVSGLIFMFCPYHFAHALGHMNLISIEWIPLYVLFLIRTIRESTKRNPVYAAFFLLLNAISSLYYLMYMVVFTFLFLAYYQATEKSILKKSVLVRISIMAVSFGMVTLPLMYSIARELLTSRSDYMYPEGFVIYSADLLSFLTPSQLHPLLNPITYPISSTFTGNSAEFTVFAGYIVLLLSALTILKIKRREIKFWTLSAGIYFLLALGPVLHIAGLRSVPCEGINVYIPLPYLILMNLPILSLLRVTSRWDVLLMLCLALLAGYGIKYIMDRYVGQRASRRGVLLLLLISSLVLFEFLSIPYPMSDAKIPEFYEQLGADKGNYAILEVPNYSPESLYYQTTHQKKLIGGYIGRVNNKGYPAFISQLVGISTGDQSNLIGQDILALNITDIGAITLNNLNIRYVILHTDRMDKNQLDFARSLLKSALRKEPQIYGSLEVYEVGKVENGTLGSRVMLNEGWYAKETWNDKPTRWIGEEASIIVFSKEAESAKLKLYALSFNRARTLKIYVNGIQSGQVCINNSEFVPVNVSLNRGTNLILLHTAEGCERPRDITSMKNGDTRCLSLAIQNISIDST
jgi:hypothetical protein